MTRPLKRLPRLTADQQQKIREHMDSPCVRAKANHLERARSATDRAKRRYHMRAYEAAVQREAQAWDYHIALMSQQLAMVRDNLPRIRAKGARARERRMVTLFNQPPQYDRGDFGISAKMSPTGFELRQW